MTAYLKKTLGFKEKDTDTEFFGAKCLQFAARDFERRWGGAPINPHADECQTYICWRIKGFGPSGWLTSREN